MRSVMNHRTLTTLLLLGLCTWPSLSRVDPDPAGRYLSALTEPSALQALAERVASRYEAAKQFVELHWAYSPDMLCESAQVFGLQKKAASVRDIPILLSWEQQGIALPAGVPIYADPTVFISKKFRFIYIRQWRASSTTILMAITRTFCGPHGVCTADELTSVAGGMATIPEAIWAEYVVFTWVRNPWVRAIRMHHTMCAEMLRLKSSGAQEPGASCCIQFDEFSGNPGSLIDACALSNCCFWNRHAQPAAWDQGAVPRYVSDQSHSVFAPDGRAAVDFIGRTEHTEDDWAELLQHMNTRAGWHFEPHAIEHPPGGEASRAEAVCSELLELELDEHWLRGLAGVYAADLVSFGFFAVDANTQTA